MNYEELLSDYLKGAARAREAAGRKKAEAEPGSVAVVRLTTPGLEDCAVLAEWQGVARVKSLPQWEEADLFRTGIAMDYGTPRMVGLVWDLDLSNTEVTSPNARAWPLADRVGLELWVPIGVELDPLDPRYNWDTSVGTWAKARYHHAYVGAWERWGDRDDMTVSVVQSGTEMFRIEEVKNDGQ